MRKYNLDKLKQSFKNVAQKGSNVKQDDDRFLNIDLADGSFAKRLIFLPDVDGNLFVNNHSFYYKDANTGLVYWEKTAKSINKRCPFNDWRYKNKHYWKEDQNNFPKMSVKYISNVLVLDKKGKVEGVKLFRYGNQVLRRIEILVEGDDFSESRCPTKHIFRLKVIKNNAGYPNYEGSTFEDVEHKIDLDKYEPLSLDEWTKESGYGSYNELQEKLYGVLGYEKEFIEEKRKIDEAEKKASKETSSKTLVDDDDIDF